VIAAPPVRGSAAGSTAIAFSAHLAGLVSGSLAVAAVPFVIGTELGHPPRWVLGLLAAFLAAASARLPWLKLRGSPWRVPSSWGRIGRVPYAAMFGFTLGTGLLNALSSPAYFLLLAWSSVTGSWPAVVVVSGAFSLARALPVMVTTALSGRDDGALPEVLRRLRSVASYLFSVEAIALMALAVVWL
jgi:hypothetical protein